MHTGWKQPIRPFACVLGGLPFWGSLLVAWLVLAGSQAAAQPLQRPAASSYDVVALRVEFQPDTTRFTTGNGTFDAPLYDESLSPNVDPLPHDAAYFQAHLDFLSHYVQRVSDGQTVVRTHIVPEVIRVSQQMGAYSPTGFDADSEAERSKLAALIQEAWALATEESSFDMAGFDIERTAFVLFHAGVGRDVELLGTTLDKTPLDLPSISFTERSLENLGINNLRFNGFPVRNTLIIPRTETRQAFDFIADEPLLLELSINGLLAASFFNYLGVPDLFNTETGESALGPFGLMDPLGIFAFNGLFPPEPMGWTKFYLGWTPALELDPASSDRINLEAASLLSDALSPDALPSLARASISPAEYFLIENRNRDPEGDGLVMQVFKDGAIVEQRISNSDSSFTRFNIEGFTGGVVVAVDNYDWAVPGGVDDDGNALNGGLLIWHIDERRLRAGFTDNSVNADPERRAIDLEEADSAQDIGFPSNNPFAAPVDQGTPFDFFYQGNPATAITATGQEVQLYQNRFGPDTVPDSDTNEGGPSFIVLDDFSAPGPTMSFLFRREAAESIAPLFSENLGTAIPFVFGSAITPLDTGQPAFLFFTGDTPQGSAAGVYREDTGGIPFEREAEALRTAVLPDGRVLLAEIRAGGSTVVFSVQEGAGEAEEIGSTEGLGLNVQRFASPLVGYQQNGSPTFAVIVQGPTPAERYLLTLFEDGILIPEQIDVNTYGLASDGEQLILIGHTKVVRQDGTLLWSMEALGSGVVGQPIFGRNAGFVGIIPLIGENALLFLREDGSTERINLSHYADVLGGEQAMNAFPVLVDLDSDGRLDVLTTYGSNLVAFTQNGALVRGFPIRLSAPSVAQPLAARLTESNAWSVIVASTDGNVYAYDTGNDGRIVDGFPLAVGSRVLATPLLQNKKMYAISEEGSLKGWQLDGLGDIWWGQLYGDAQSQSYVVLSDSEQPTVPEAGGLIVDNETYNWPNPIRNGETFLRCMTREDARVEITIVDAAGALVKEMAMDLRGGTPAEEVWQTGAASGVYFARVKATTDTGETATKLIKMAIIR